MMKFSVFGNVFSPSLFLCSQKPGFDSGKYEGEEVLLVRAYGSSFFSLGINIRFLFLHLSCQYALKLLRIILYETVWLITALFFCLIQERRF